MEAIKLTELQQIIGKVEIVITSASFEDRCFSVINSLNKDSYRELWICYNKNEEKFFSENVEKLKAYNKNFSLVEFSTDDPIISSNSILTKFREIETSLPSILVDITTFTHEGLLILFKFIELNKSLFGNIHLVYTGASDYDTEESDIDKKWLTKGTKSIRSILGYPGVLRPSRKNHLVILFGFESERTQRLIETFEFDIVSLGFGPEKDSITESHYKINRKRHLELLEIFPFAEKFEFSLTDAFLTKKQILEQVKKYPEHNTVLAPLNNKISTIGVAMAATEKPEMQVCYIRAHEYNMSGYSSPSDNCYIINYQ